MSGNNNNYTEEEITGKAFDLKLMKRLLAYARPYWKYFLTAVLLLFASTTVDLAMPYIMKIIIDDYISIGDAGSLERIGLVFIGLIISGFIFNLLQIYVLSYTGQAIIYNIRQKIFAHMQKLPLNFFDHNPVGRLVTRVTSDTETLNDMYTNVLVNLIKDFSILAGVTVMMFKLNYSLAFKVLLSMPLVVLVTAVFRVKIRKVYRRVRKALAHINSVLSENISGMRIIQIFNKENEKYDEFKKVNDEYYKAGISEIVVFGVFRPVVEMIAALIVALAIWYGGIRVIDGTLQFGVLYAFVYYIQMFFHPIIDLSEKYNILQAAMASSERIFMVLDTPPEKDKGENKLDSNYSSMDIEFKNVWFAYKEDEWVLRNVSFKVPSGKTIAIVGATGAGKTSIINILNRFYDVQQGEILIGETDIKDINKDSLRKNIGVVLQDVFLFSGTIKDNIRLNEAAISDETIMKASEYVNADKFILKLPNMYDEEVMERGSTLSSGQRQLLAFARALAFNPPILVLDEATSNIDTETELLIQDALSKLTKNRTTIIIAHRLSTIQHADNIIVLHKGKVRESGNHQELMSKKGMYYNLYGARHLTY
jgi:ATP-binding cassette subfamily B multidrug efflux pump